VLVPLLIPGSQRRGVDDQLPGDCAVGGDRALAADPLEAAADGDRVPEVPVGELDAGLSGDKAPLTG
jgi:hypothetical protein